MSSKKGPQEIIRPDNPLHPFDGETEEEANMREREIAKLVRARGGRRERGAWVALWEPHSFFSSFVVVAHVKIVWWPPRACDHHPCATRPATCSCVLVMCMHSAFRGVGSGKGAGVGAGARCVLSPPLHNASHSLPFPPFLPPWP